MATKLAFNPITWKFDLIAKPWANQGDFQYNSNDNFEGNANLSTDWSTVFIGDEISSWAVNDTYFLNGWFQSMQWTARPKKRMYCDLRPRTTGSVFDLLLPPVEYWFWGIDWLPCYYRRHNASELEWIPFAFMIPEDYQSWTPLYWKLHFSTKPDQMTIIQPWSVWFDIEYSSANNQRDCRGADEFANSQNRIASCVDWVQILQTKRPHYNTEDEYTRDVLLDYQRFATWDIIEWKITRNCLLEEDTFDGGVVPLYLTIQYASDKLWKADDGRDYL